MSPKNIGQHSLLFLQIEFAVGSFFPTAYAGFFLSTKQRDTQLPGHFVLRSENNPAARRLLCNGSLGEACKM
jgi:hypothetical protein